MNNETFRRARRVLTGIIRQSIALRIVLVCLCLFTAQRTVRAQAGGRDTSFGADGRVTTDFNAAANGVNAVALQPDGRIVVAGFSFSAATNSNDFAAVRYNADGTLDTSFGTGGLATFDFAGRDDVAYAVRLQSDGKIVLAGRTRDSSTGQSDFAYARLRPDGIPEGGSDGSATADFGGDDEAHALTIQANNRILLAGFTSTAAGTDFALARYDFRAAPDAAFGTNGRIVTDFAAGDDRAFAVRLQPDGKIIAAGQTEGEDGLDFAAARYNPDGTLDQTFAPGGPDGDGRSTISFGPAPDAARAVDLQTDGRIILAGFTGTGAASDFALVRLGPNGFADVSFGTDGFVATDFDAGEDAANGVAIQPDGRIVAAGSTPAGFAAARYNIDGTPDTTFDGDGRATIAFASGGSAARGVVLQPNGRIVLAGSVVGAGGGGASDVAVARLHAGATFVVNSVADTLDPGDGATTLREAIDAANSNAETTLDTIQFDIDPLNPNPANPNAPPCPELTILGTPSRVCRITPATDALPALTQPTIIDGYSQLDARPNAHTLAGANGGGTKLARILLELSGIGGTDDGLTLTGGSVVRGLSIIGFRGSGVILAPQSQSTDGPDYPGNRVEGCYFGIRPDGSHTGVTGNLESSIFVFGSDYSIIGTNLDDSLDQTERNVISNSTAGVLFRDVNETEFGEDTRFNRVQGNLIGTDSGGTVAVPNINGVVFNSRGLTSNNVVGNFYKEAANVISGNTSAGVRVAAEANSLGNYTGAPSANEVRGNIIGLAGGLEVRELFESGLDAPNLPLSPLPNGGHGIHLLGADGTVVGTNLEGATSGNIIQFNGGDGVRVETVLLFPAEEGQTAGANNSILGNRIDRNDGLGIDLAPGGVNENDGDDPSTVDVTDPDADAGANNLQNFPVIASAVTTGGTTTILGTLESVPAQTYVVEFYSCGKCDPNAADTTVGTHGEGQVPLGTTTTTTDDEGHAAFTFVPASPINVGRNINATASLVTSDAPTFETSEFSSCAQVTEETSPTPTPTPSPTPTPTPSADLSIEKTASVNPAEVGRIFTYNITVSNAGLDAANTVTVTDSLPASATFTSATPTQGSCALASGTLTCQLGTIAAGSSASIALQVKPRQTGTLMNTASVTAAESDPDTSDNSSTSTINVIRTADLKVAKSDSPDPIFVGEQTTYTLLVTNLGPLNAATGVVLTDSLPSSMTFVSATTTQGSLVTPPVGSTGLVTANIGSLAVNAQATVLITVRAAQPGAIVNTATVSGNETDTNTVNNTATQTTTVKAAALQKVLLAKQVLTGGCENTTGNVYLTGPAPPGGLTVSLSSNVTGASVPASVFIPAGQSVSPAFGVTTSHVGAKQAGLVAATLGASSVSRGITINVGNGTCP